MKVGIIGDEETVSGFCLAGAGFVEGSGFKSFMVVDDKTHAKDTADKFKALTERNDIAMVVITQKAADTIPDALAEYSASGKVVPTVLQIPTKEKPYDPRQDPVMRLVAMFRPSAMAELGVV